MADGKKLLRARAQDGLKKVFFQGAKGVDSRANGV
jgi:hypothetical protein